MNIDQIINLVPIDIKIECTFRQIRRESSTQRQVEEMNQNLGET